ncbi:MAG: CHAT domain-containing protein, partial [Acidobacteriota bacterium]
QGSPRDLIYALTTIDKAISVDASLLEARFNRALILERIYLLPAAKQAWQEYILLDKSSEWAVEARNHIVELSKPIEETRWRAEQVGLVELVYAGRNDVITDIVSRHPHQARVYAIDELLPKWATAHLSNQSNDAEKYLKATRAIAEILVKLQHDNLVSDLVAAIDMASREPDAARLASLATAHQIYQQSLAFFAKNQVDQAGVLIDQARHTFIDNGNVPGEALLTLLQARVDDLRLNYQQALAELLQVRRIAIAHNYPYLLGRVGWLIGNIQTLRFEIGDALQSRLTALNYLEATGDKEGVAMVHFLIAYNLDQAGDIEQLWRHQHQALAWISKVDQSRFRLNILTGIATLIGKNADPAIALYFYQESIRISEALGDEVITATSFLERSFIHNKLRNKTAALADLANASKHLVRVSDQTFRARLEREMAILEGEYSIEENPDNAVKLFTELINAYSATTRRYEATRLYLARAHAYLALKNDLQAELDLVAGLKEFERQRSNIHEIKQRISFFEKPQDVYYELIGFQALRKGRADLAFNYAEAMRARALLDMLDGQANLFYAYGQPALMVNGDSEQPQELAKIQRALPEGTVLLEYAVLADRVLIWMVSHESFHMAETIIDNNSLTVAVMAFRDAIERGAQSAELKRLSTRLYQMIISPILPTIPKQATLVIIPDRILNTVPFAALLAPQTDRYLIADHVIEIAPSATVFLRCLQRNRRLHNIKTTSALIVGNPLIDRSNFPNLPYLGEAEQEAEQIAKFYPQVKLLTGAMATKDAFLAAIDQYNVVHFAGHALMDTNRPLSSALLLAAASNNGTGYTGTLMAHELYGQRFKQTRLVVLAACQTASGRYSRGEGIASLVRPFLAAGVPAVVASLWNVNDSAAAKLFFTFHKRLTQGEDPASALRSSQLSLLNDEDEKLRSPTFWAPFVLLGGIESVNPN